MAERSNASVLKTEVLNRTVGSNPTSSSTDKKGRRPVRIVGPSCLRRSNMFSILLTNSFSIIGTIMGVKYASEEKE